MAAVYPCPTPLANAFQVHDVTRPRAVAALHPRQWCQVRPDALRHIDSPAAKAYQPRNITEDSVLPVPWAQPGIAPHQRVSPVGAFIV